MSRRCGCAGQDCSCTVVGGTGISVTGTGSASNPFRIDSTQSLTFTVADTGSVDLFLSGSGTIDDPTVLTATATLTIPTVHVDTFSASGTWTRPVGKSIARVTVIAGGGGGGSGCRDAAGTVRCGGMGGGGGGASTADFQVSDLPASVSVTIGAGGTGGAAQTVNASGGIAGNNGANTTFGTVLSAWAGTRGEGGQHSAMDSGGVWGTGGLGVWPGGQAGSIGIAGGTDPISNAPSFNFSVAASAGGNGGGIGSTGTIWPAVAGGDNFGYQVSGGTAGGTGAAGGTGVVPTLTAFHPGGTGGGGGGASATAAAGSGGNGVRGSGGGGGGASLNGFNSGAGGRGGDGFVSIVTW
jgi:hypothetical protein